MRVTNSICNKTKGKSN